VSDWGTCEGGEGFASGCFRLKVCRRDDNGGSKGTVILGLPVTGEDGTEEYLYGWLREGPARCECRSDKFVCMRRMATPPSSTEKLKPRCGVICPVDISVRLPLRQSPQKPGRETFRDDWKDLRGPERVDSASSSFVDILLRFPCDRALRFPPS